MKRSLLVFYGALLATSAAARDSATGPSLHYKPPAGPLDDRPLALDISVTPQGNDIALTFTFDKVPWGEDCKARCANTTLFIDTDDNRATGLQLGKDKAETGADLEVIVQGAREYKEKSADVFLRARVRQLTDGITSPDQGELLTDMDHRNDPERVQSNGKAVFLLLDTTNLSLPSGRTMRIIYHPPGDKALEATGKGLLGAGGVKLESIQGIKGKKRRK